MTTSAMSIHTPSGNRNTESVSTHKITPCGYFRTVTSTVAVDTSRNSRYHYGNCFHENIDYMPKFEF